MAKKKVSELTVPQLMWRIVGWIVKMVIVYYILMFLVLFLIS